MRTSAGQDGKVQRNGTGMFPREVVQKPHAASSKARPQGAAPNRHPVPDRVDQQMCLKPQPKVLVLRNHV
jgi:hypothetical protein